MMERRPLVRKVLHLCPDCGYFKWEPEFKRTRNCPRCRYREKHPLEAHVAYEEEELQGPPAEHHAVTVDSAQEELQRLLREGA